MSIFPLGPFFSHHENKAAENPSNLRLFGLYSQPTKVAAQQFAAQRFAAQRLAVPNFTDILNGRTKSIQNSKKLSLEPTRRKRKKIIIR